MKSVLRGSFATLGLAALLIIGLFVNGNVAWVSHQKFEANSDKFSSTATCFATQYKGFGFNHTVVTGHAPLGGSSGAAGGFVASVDYTIPDHPYTGVLGSWGRTAFYGNINNDQHLMVASACSAQ